MARDLASQTPDQGIKMSGIPVNQVLDELKDFQRRSVDYVYRRLYEDPEPARRFLIADEVGLGKTLVARGLIAKAVDRLWQDKSIGRIDVIYICSNANIARQNINRLRIGDGQGFALASRITLLPLTLHSLDSRLNFVSFTPGTSFDLRSSGGVKRERALLYYMLRDEWQLGRRAGPINLLQCGAGRESWRSFLQKDFLRRYSIDGRLATAFLHELRDYMEESRRRGEPNLHARFEDLAGRFARRWKHPTQSSCRARDKLIGKLRFILAEACVKFLEPDLIILDEFQRFKDLLDKNQPMGRLAHQLFGFQDAAAADHQTKIVLLSATPYKMYTMYQEAGDDDHYEDFLSTVKFLFDSAARTSALRKLLRAYRSELYKVGIPDDRSLQRLQEVKRQIEAALRSVMIRTERPATTHGPHGMVVEHSSDQCQLQPQDLAAFKTVDTVAQALEAGDHLEYWKSSPYLLNLMDNYVLKRRLTAAIESGEAYDSVGEAIRDGRQTLLNPRAVGSYQRIDPANAKLRTLIADSLGSVAWKLLWIPPSLPYYQPRGVYADLDDQNLTKSLVFSNWRVVPKAIAMLCSYEAERRMVSLYTQQKNVPYSDLTRARRPLLRFNRQDDRLTGMYAFTLLYPCLTLAQQVDPLSLGMQLASGAHLPSYEQLHEAIRKKVESLLELTQAGSSRRPSTPDRRWYWAAPVLLDRFFNRQPLARWLDEEDEAWAWEAMVPSRSDRDDTHFSEHVAELRRAVRDPASLELGAYPDDLTYILAKVAMASPAVTVLRALCRHWPGIERQSKWRILSAAALAAMGFRSLFNLPESIISIRHPDDPDEAEQGDSGDTVIYWQRVLDYAVDGNLQAVVDEYVHILHESLGLGIGNRDPGESARELASEIQDAISLRTISLTFHEIALQGQKIQQENYRMRCRYALPFGRGRNYDDGAVTRRDQVRIAFNSPFRPFVLAATSAGQEGLDFHQYCHAVYHWNLPSNPVDLEQREGRVNRFKGHAIRKNLAEKFGLSALAGDTIDDPWTRLFDMAEHSEDGLIPYWIYEEGRSRIERHIPALPLSREWEQLDHLKKALVLYRMVFGQPRQEDLLGLLQSSLSDDISTEDILQCQIDLTPP